MKRIYTSIFLLPLVLISTNLAAANIVWKGAAGANWSIGTNWVGNVKPSASDIAEFGGAGGTNNSCIIDLGQSVGGILIDAGYTQSITRKAATAMTITVGSSGFIINAGSTATFNLNNGAGNGILSMSAGNGPFTQRGGTVTLGAGVANLGTGVFTFSGTAFNCGNGGLTIGGAATISTGIFTASSSTSGSLTFGSSFSQTSGTFNGGTKLISVAGTFSLSGGTFHSTTNTLTIKNTFVNSATFDANTGTVSFSANSFSLTGITTFSNMVFDASAGSSCTFTISNGTTLTVSGNLTYNGSNAIILNSIGTGEIDMSGAGNNITLNNSSAGGGGTAVIRFLSGSGYNIQGNAIVGNSALPNLILDSGCSVNFGNNTSAVISIQNNLTDNSGGFLVEDPGETIAFVGTTNLNGTDQSAFSNLEIASGGTLTSNAVNIFVAGNFINNGTFFPNGGTVTFNGTTIISGTSTTSFNVLDNEATLTGSSGNMNVAGNFIDNGVFNHNNGTVTFNGTTTFPGTPTSLSGVTTFYNFTVSGSASSVVLPASITVDRAFTDNTSPSVLNALANSNTLTFDGAATSIFTLSATTLNNIIISSGTLTGDAGTISLKGNFTNNAAYTHNSGTIVFNGTLGQTIGGSSTTNFYHLTLSNAAGASLTQNENLEGVLTISSGTFDVNGKTFTLISTIAGTASIAPILGSIAGNITIQRWTGNGPNDWRFLGTAVSGQFLSNWMTYFAMSGFTNATCNPSNCLSAPNCSTDCNWVSVYTYNESVPYVMDSGYVAATNTSNPIVMGTGYYVYLGSNPITFSVTGAPYTGLKNLPVSYTNNLDATNDGWNLVSNPYPSAIDWENGSWTKNHLTTTFYIWNSNLSSWASYTSGSGGVGPNGGSNLIPSQQAFWVKADGTGTPALSVVEAVKSNTLNTQYMRMAHSHNTSHTPMAFNDFSIPLNTNNTPNNLTLTVSGSGFPNDEMWIRFMQGASADFDNQYDAYKLKGYYSNLSSVTNSIDYAVNTLPSLTSNIDIPIRLNVYAAGNYTISRDSVLMLPANSCLILEDLDPSSMSMTDLRSTISYSFTITDTTGQAHAAPRFILHVYAPMTVKGKNITCNGANNGMAIAKGSGTGPWNYQWKNSAGTIIKTISSSTADTLLNCAPDKYSVTATGAVCGTFSDTIVLLAPPVLTNSVSLSNISCFGLDNGSVSISPLGGSPSYSYLWDNNQTTSSISNLSHGDYSVVTTDAYGCTTTSTVTIAEPTVLTNSVTQTNVSCFGANSGTATAIVSGGSTTYSYSWSGGQTTSAAANLLAGIYSLTVSDANGCTKTATVNITQPTAALTVSTSVSSAQCNNSNGSASAVVAGGTSGYSYLWNNNLTTSAITGIHAGSYSVTITDTNGCSANSVANVSNIGGVTASIASTTTVTCPGGNDGSATAGITGGTPTVSYSWNTTSLQTSVSATGLSAGNYIVTATDGTGCISLASVTIPEPSALSASFSKTNVSCFSGNNGSATISESGGTPSYSYYWNTGNTTSSVSNLSAGNYSVTTTDSHGCTKNSIVTVTQPTSPISFTATKTNISCFGANNGQLAFSAIGGTPSYSYLWNNNQTTSSSSLLTSGIYSITATDANGCTKDSSFTIAEPPVLTYSVSLTNISCFGGSNGTSSIAASGGTPSYSYLWSDGQTSSTANNLSVGNYSVKITDANGCSTSTIISIAQPSSKVTAGFAASTYTVDLAVSGTVNFTNNSIGSSIYQWNFGDTTAINNVANPSHSYIHTGTYTVMLTASDGTCSDVIYKTIVVTNSNPLAVASPISSSSVNVIYDNNEVFLQFSLNKKTQINITVYNLIGEKISSQNNLQIKNEKIKLDLHNPSAGIYLAVSETPDGNISKKIVIPADR